MSILTTMNVKLTARQEEAINKILMDEVKIAFKRRDRRGPLEESISNSVDVYDVAYTVASNVQKSWEGAYDDNDPVMSAVGRDGWAEQCEAASQNVFDDVADVINRVQEQLVGGEFNYGDGQNTARGGAPNTVRDHGVPPTLRSPYKR